MDQRVTPVRLLAIIEASVITGPAKNLLQFAALAAGRHPPVLVDIATFRRPGDSDLFSRAVREHGLRLFEIPEKSRFDGTVLPRLCDLVRSERPDLIQTHAVKSHYLLRLSGAQGAIPWIAFHHGYTWPDFRARIYNQLDRWSLRAASRVITVSRPFQQELVRMGVRRTRIEVVHNAIDPGWGARWTREAGEALRKELGVASGSKVALIVGRLSREKDHLTLLRALAAIRSAGLPLHLIIVGDGPERLRIEHAAKEFALTPFVSLVGQRPSAEPYYNIADVAVLSSRSEGSPNALLEAMAAGVPAVATAVGGVPEIVEDGVSALLVKPRDAGGMANAITSLLNDVDRRRLLEENARRVIRDRHAPQSRTAKLCAIYGAVLARA
jgi:glycosyltransferase involved in cell wall biosynthesis